MMPRNDGATNCSRHFFYHHPHQKHQPHQWCNSSFLHWIHKLSNIFCQLIHQSKLNFWLPCVSIALTIPKLHVYRFYFNLSDSLIRNLRLRAIVFYFREAKEIQIYLINQARGPYWENRELKQRRRRRQGRRLLKNEFIFCLRISQLSRSVQFAYSSKNVLRLNM